MWFGHEWDVFSLRVSGSMWVTLDSSIDFFRLGRLVLALVTNAAVKCMRDLLLTPPQSLRSQQAQQLREKKYSVVKTQPSLNTIGDPSSKPKADIN